LDTNNTSQGKPISLLRDDFMNQFQDLLNNCNLPLIILEPIIENTLRQIKAMNQQQLERDRAEWEANHLNKEDKEPA